MKKWAHRTVGLLLLAAGIIAGNVLAKDAPFLRFEKVTLFNAMLQLHDKTATDIVFANSNTKERSFTLPAGHADAAVALTARQFDRTPVPVSRIFVLRDALPEAKSPTDRLDAVYDLVGDRMALHAYTDGVKGEAKRLSGEISPGLHPFSTLTPEQRQDLLSLLRASDTQVRARYLFVLMQAWESAHRAHCR